MRTLKQLFTDHPREVGLSYFGHAKYSATVTARLFAYAFACTLHTFFPFLFTHSISDFVRRMNEEFNGILPYYAEESAKEKD